MSDGSSSIQRQRCVLLISLLLSTFTLLCAWGSWAAAQPDWSAFMVADAHDIQYKRLGPGLNSLEFGYDGKVTAQSFHIYAAAARRGWRINPSIRAEDCSGPCLLGEITLIFTRHSLFNRVTEVVTIDQSGIGPYRVRVVLRRCIQLPRMKCWPSG